MLSWQCFLTSRELCRWCCSLQRHPLHDQRWANYIQLAKRCRAVTVSLYKGHVCLVSRARFVCSLMYRSCNVVTSSSSMLLQHLQHHSRCDSSTTQRNALLMHPTSTSVIVKLCQKRAPSTVLDCINAVPCTTQVQQCKGSCNDPLSPAVQSTQG